ncbi:MULTISPECIES: sarcosine oxidase subunit gamma family protein [Microbacterium]|uniref:sarcosine oxidase subunit gamma n=1 Tax=Microbacterium TaxID=33882 RepID=UPI000D64FB00|nr:MULTISPECIES: sarcosine oxidase subunit gamma family protein [Microbacterium]
MAEPTATAEHPADLRVSPAAHLAAGLHAGSAPGVVTLREEPFLTMIGVRVAPGTDAARRLEDVVAPLPLRCGATARVGDTTILWLGPEEFLVVAPASVHAELGGKLQSNLTTALGDDAGQVVDLSANRTAFELSGPRALAVLQKGCALDLHPRVLPVGAAVSTEVGGVALILWRTDETTYRLMPRASFSDFAAAWLLDAMREYTGESAA